MYWETLSELTAAVKPQVNLEFIDASCLSQIQSIAKLFPAKAASSFLFERRLGRNDTRIDFALSLNENGAAWFEVCGLWPEIRDLLARASAETILGPSGLWFEFDTSQQVKASESPSVYVGIKAARDNRSALLALAQCLNNRHEASVETVGRCIASFPSSVRRLYVGAMRSRNVSGIRLSIDCLGHDHLVDYLYDVRWPGDIDRVGSFIARFASVCKRFGVQIDVAAEMRSWLGIELMVETPHPDAYTARSAKPLLEALVREELCSTFESEELAKWPSNTTYVAPLIDRLIEGADPRPQARLRHGALVTAVNHVKISFDPDGTILTKAYLRAALQPL
jgi:hypothetical protein